MTALVFRGKIDFFVYGRREIEGVDRASHDVPHSIISIQTPRDPNGLAWLPINEHTLGVLRLVFHDLDERLPEAEAERILGKDPGTLFSKEMGEQVVRFVRKFVANRILVHCDAGLSRSPAVAAAIARGLGQNDTEFFERLHPNMRVYRSILRAFEFEGEEVRP